MLTTEILDKLVSNLFIQTNFLRIGECRFQNTNSRWSVNLEGGTNDVECNNEEFCLATANLDRSDCEYSIKQLREDGFGAEVFGLSLGYNEILITSI